MDNESEEENETIMLNESNAIELQEKACCVDRVHEQLELIDIVVPALKFFTLRH
jgi:hypothetical protein